jgi:hypothetical protein
MEEDSTVLAAQQLPGREPAGLYTDKGHAHLGAAEDDGGDDAMATRDQNSDDSGTADDNLTETADAGISALKARRSEIESKVEALAWVLCRPVGKQC